MFEVFGTFLFVGVAGLVIGVVATRMEMRRKMTAKGILHLYDYDFEAERIRRNEHAITGVADTR